MAECVGDAIVQGWAEFPRIWRFAGRDETLFRQSSRRTAASVLEKVGRGLCYYALVTVVRRA